MISNYFKIAWRNLWKHKTFSAIIVFGMAIAFAAALLLSLTAYRELSFDKFHANKDNLYQVYEEEYRHDGTERNSSMPMPLTPALKKEYPAIAHITRFGSSAGNLVRYNNKEIDLNVRAVDQDFFEMFSFPIVSGNKTSPLRELNDLALTENCAKRLFNTEDPLGKMVEIKMNDEWKSFKVSSVIQDFPDNSSFTFDMFTRFEHFPNYEQNKDNWDASTHEVFVQLRDGTKQLAFEEQLRSFNQRYFKGKIEQLQRDQGRKDAKGDYLRLRTIPFKDLHFSEISGTGAGINKFYPYLLLIISAFILFIACVNFVNLSLARSFTRSKEIGIRKVVGAQRWQLVRQFWGEALLVCFLALLLGMLIAYLLLPYYKATFNQSISVGILKSPMVIVYTILAFGLVTMFAGGYPAWVVSALDMVKIVKGKLTSGKSHFLRNTLMVIQFTFSCLLIISTIIVWNQINYLRSKPLGYNKQQVISIPIGSAIDPEKSLALMRNKLAAEPNVIAVTATDMNLGRGRDGSSSTSIMGFDYKNKGINTHWLRIDYDYLKALEIKLITGRDFSREFADTGAVLINQQMANALGEKDPLNAVLDIDGSRLKVIGVVQDFHFKSLHRQIEPLTMVVRPGWTISYLFVRVKPDNLPASLARIEKAWKEINPKANFEASFLDENTDNQYRKESRMSKIFMSGAILAIVISCMGLFGIALLAIIQRTKEIGIRKVMGAGTMQIVRLVSKDFIILVIIAIVISSPIAWFAMNKWLENFAYRVAISWWVFAAAAVMAILIAFITLSFQSIRAALGNPVKALRSE